ncbi:MAG: hypothetical protein V1725_03745 [archaeon]
MAVLDESEFEQLLRYQRQMATSIINDAEIDVKIKILNMIDDMSKGKRKKIQMEQLLIEGQIEGLTERDIRETIEKLKADNLVIEPETGYVQKT